MKPVIGVMPLVDEERQSLWMLPGYLEGIRQAGGLPLILPLTTDLDELEQLLGLCDGLLFTGGQDVSPALYHESELEGLVQSCTPRDRMEQAALAMALRQGIPVLGICRGLQLINAALGGTLYQDLPAQHPSEIVHKQQPPYDVPVHPVQVLKATPLAALLQVENLQVNSYHHQAVKTLAPPLQPMALSPDGLIEAAYAPGKPFVWAVQWHPEFSYPVDPASRAIFAAFVTAAGNVRVIPLAMR